MKEKKRAAALHFRILDSKWDTLRYRGMPAHPYLYDGSDGRESALERLRSEAVIDDLEAILVALETELDRALARLHLDD